MGRDAFGFPAARYDMFAAEGSPRSIDISPVPMANRPESFAGAVGDNFSIKVDASRTVVSVGEPIELSILLRSTSPLEGLALPNLTSAGLPADKFSVPSELPTGEITDDGKGKLFKVAVRLTEANVRSIPALQFSYFDPTAGEYRTTHSEPIALSVHGSSLVGANDVVGGATSNKQATVDDVARGAVGAVLSLSHRDDTLNEAPSLSRMIPWLVALYLAPLLLLGGVLWQRKTKERRGQSSVARRARKNVMVALEAARNRPAREAGPELVTALRNFARVTDGIVNAELVARIETESFDPRSATEPLAEPTLKRVQEHLADGRQRSRKSTAAAALCLLASLGAHGAARAEAAPSSSNTESLLASARKQYAEALTEKERERRLQQFARAEELLAGLVHSHPRRPELLTDWGNAALGAGNLGTAVLAYRRALALDPSLTRARRNLSWLREHRPDWVPSVRDDGAMSSVFFWQGRWTVARQHLVAAAAFALAVLLLIPWNIPQRRWLRAAAILPGLLCLAMWASILMQPNRRLDVVVVSDGELLRSADSVGAPPALARPLPGGVEATLAERRGTWTRIAFADGTDGWLPSTAVAMVTPPAGTQAQR